MKNKIIVTLCLPVICMLLLLAVNVDTHAKAIYTTNEKTNAVAEKIINSCTNDEMSKEEKLRNVFYYLVSNMRYSWSTGSARIKVTKKEVKATKKKAKAMKVSYSSEFHNRYKNVASLQGTCYGMAKVFCILANHLGYKAHVVHGRHVTGGHSSSHYWCYVIVKGEKKYFDVQYANRCYKRNSHSSEIEGCFMADSSDSYWRAHYHR